MSARGKVTTEDLKRILEEEMKRVLVERREEITKRVLDRLKAEGNATKVK